MAAMTTAQTITSTPIEAKARSEKIKAGLEAIAPLVEEAFRCHDAKTLGYSSWKAYVKGEFGGQLRLTKPERKETVVTMRRVGASMPAIAAMVGAAVKTVHRDIAEYEAHASLSFDKDEPLPTRVVDLQGVERPAKRPVGEPPKTKGPKRMTVVEVRQQLDLVERALFQIIPGEVVPTAHATVDTAMPRIQSWLNEWGESLSTPTE